MEKQRKNRKREVVHIALYLNIILEIINNKVISEMVSFYIYIYIIYIS